MIGSGGSAFVDGGFGALAYGMGIFKVYGSEKELLDKIKPHQIREVSHLEISSPEKATMLDELEVLMPCDVEN